MAKCQEPVTLGASGINQWLVTAALAGNDLCGLLEGLCVQLHARGVPLEHATLSMPSVDPTVRGFTIEWRHGETPRFSRTEHGQQGEAAFKGSLIHQLLSEGVTCRQWRLEGAPLENLHPRLQALAAEGITDYRLDLVHFPQESTIIGLALATATETPGGFQAEHTGLVAAILPTLGLAVYRIAISRLLNEVLGVYVGAETSRKILSGDIRRGEGRTITAAILFADIRGYTSLTEAHSSNEVIGLLNQQFDALGGAIENAGGEILKFMGDGILAIFPSRDSGDRLDVACAQALGAARSATAAIATLNIERRKAGLPAMLFDIALHAGDVFYGNVGTARRLDFTVIGTAVNEVSRIEKLCEPLGQAIVLSAEFAERTSADVILLGSFQLQGVASEKLIYGLKAVSGGTATVS